MVILGYPGVQALDMVGPFDVFTGATQNLAAQNRADEGYDVTIASVDGAQIATGTGLALSPNHCLTARADRHRRASRRMGLDEARKNPGVVDWVKAVSGTARAHRQRVYGCVPRRAGGSARRLQGDHALGVRR